MDITFRPCKDCEGVCRFKKALVWARENHNLPLDQMQSAADLRTQGFATIEGLGPNIAGLEDHFFIKNMQEVHTRRSVEGFVLVCLGLDRPDWLRRMRLDLFPSNRGRMTFRVIEELPLIP